MVAPLATGRLQINNDDIKNDAPLADYLRESEFQAKAVCGSKETAPACFVKARKWQIALHIPVGASGLRQEFHTRGGLA